MLRMRRVWTHLWWEWGILSDPLEQSWALHQYCCLWGEILKLFGSSPNSQVPWKFWRALHSPTETDFQAYPWDHCLSRSTHIPAQRTPHSIWLLIFASRHHERGSILRLLCCLFSASTSIWNFPNPFCSHKNGGPLPAPKMPVWKYRPLAVSRSEVTHVEDG